VGGYGQVVGWTALPTGGNELHHFGWNACSSALCHNGHGGQPFISDIDLSVDDKWLYVSCFGTGELKQYDVSDPFAPRETGSVRLGGAVRNQPHPAAPEMVLSGGPQMVEVSRDGRRAYLTNSLYATWDDILYPEGVGAWMAKIDADPDGGIAVDPRFFPNGDEFRGMRVHQTRLQGGDASSDSYCFTG
jgi:selenium-binding protein 1